MKRLRYDVGFHAGHLVSNFTSRGRSLAIALACVVTGGMTSPITQASTSSSLAVTELQTSVTTPWGIVKGPSLPTSICTTLAATLHPVNGSIDNADKDPAHSQPDTKRIQEAIDRCPVGQAVKLTKDAHGATGFLSAPLRLKSGVTLWIDKDVTLFASRNPSDYDNGPGTCGTATRADEHACNPFILADNTVDSGIVGDGAIDGRGGSVLTHGPNAGLRSWWDVAFQNKTEKLSQQNPILIHIKGGSDFTLYRVAILNSPAFHVLPSGVNGVTAWGIKILSPSLEYTKPAYACPAGSTPDKTTPATCFTPETVKNTDGFDPAQSSKVLLAYSYISDGDDNVAVKSHGKLPSTDLAFLHNHFYYGHGMSIGSETDAGLRNMLVQDLSTDGFDSVGGIGLRIKSDASRGGKVENVTYQHVCLRNVRQPLVFDTFYRTPDAGVHYPRFTNIKIDGLHDLGSKRYGGGTITFAGFDADDQHDPIDITLNNVVFDGPQPTFATGNNGAPSVLPFATHFLMGPGAVSFSPLLSSSRAKDVEVTGATGRSTPIDCSGAFVPYSSVLGNSPI